MMRNMNVGSKLALGFAVIAAVVVAAGCSALVGMQRLSTLTTKLYEHPFTVRRALGDADANIIKMHRSMKDVAMAPDQERRVLACRTVDELEQQVYDDLRLVRTRFLGDRESVERALTLFEEWKPIRDEVIQLTRAGETATAQEITRGKGATHVAKLETAMAGLVDFAQNKAQSFITSADAIATRVFRWTTVLITAALAIMLAIGSVLTHSVKSGLAAAVAAAQQLTRGRTDLDVKMTSQDEIGALLASMQELAETLREAARQANTIAGGDYSTDVEPRSEEDELGIALGEMTRSLRAYETETRRYDWLKTGMGRLNDTTRGEMNVRDLCTRVASEVATTLDAKVGALYLLDETVDEDKEQTLSLVGSYAYASRKNLSHSFKLGEGVVGQAALEKSPILISNVPEDYVRITSGLGETPPRFISVVPFLFEEHVTGVIEVGTLDQPTDTQLDYLNQAMSAFAIAVETARSRDRLADSLGKARALSEELQTQQEELRVSNEELQEQTLRLKDSEERLKAQQEEMEVTNEELEEKNELLERQKREVEEARKAIQEKAEEVALASKYKSEFLANMSHELRTPLNSLLLLARELAENRDGHLRDDQVESAQIIHNSGSDLLSLINEILDLAKIEAGRMDLQVGTIPVTDLASGVERAFGHMAEARGLEWNVEVSSDAPEEIQADRKRVSQVIKNLVSNAIKFTEAGSVSVTFGRPTAAVDLPHGQLDPAKALSISVKDTGVGVAPEQQKVIFEAFQQADGGTARKFGGTGLGLSISREFAALFGGKILLESEPGCGSTFTLCLPVTMKAAGEQSGVQSRKGRASEAPNPGAGISAGPQSGGGIHVPSAIADDRDSISESDTVILLIEDDPTFAGVLYGKCHERGLKCLAAASGEDGLLLAGEQLPNGIILDIRLPGMDGWSVLAALKENTRTRHIPVHVISADEPTTESLRKGAVGHATKPISREELEAAFEKLEKQAVGTTKRVLLVEDNEEIRNSVRELIGGGDVELDEAVSAGEAIEAIRANAYGCVILDLGLPDMDGAELLAKLEEEGSELPPVIVHTARDLTKEEEMGLREHAESIVIKDVRSQERLLDEASLFLHQMVSTMPDQKRQVILNLHDTDALLKDKTVLVVDDDMRTTFALSRFLAGRGMHPVKAGNGQQALSILKANADIDLVLMDIMMPVMDGYETMGRIRDQEQFRKLPIIALTAKAMPQDRQKCIDAGASDYMPKPVDQERLVSMMRVWLYR
ncbi:MAG: response regulator [Lentisphaerae bacterium]|nr:response regulator [Lentisphaerota bacterium]MBT5604495.1 response regulator [Lentisphaerota bacterium]MBT7060496.1 response regulator [Lentisphaerota bacterium]MBT7844403.1 response regulator [Lentisphaerota bacterium]